MALTDSTGSLKESYDYDAFGKLISAKNAAGQNVAAPSVKMLYTGREFDSETGLHYYRNRYYDAKQGRFISTDPTGYADGLHLYTYAQNRPTMGRDPQGLAFETLWQFVDWINSLFGDWHGQPSSPIPGDRGGGAPRGTRIDGSGARRGTREDARRNPNPDPKPKKPEPKKETPKKDDNSGPQDPNNKPPTVPVPGPIVLVPVPTPTGPALIPLPGAPILNAGSGQGQGQGTQGQGGQQGNNDDDGNKNKPSVQENRRKGDSFRDRIADFFRRLGYDVRTEVYKRTGLGGRRMDIEISRNGQVEGYVETKTGGSRYTSSQQAKDNYIRITEGYTVTVVRDR